MKKKGFVILVSVGMLLSILVGCGNSVDYVDETAEILDENNIEYTTIDAKDYFLVDKGVETTLNNENDMNITVCNSALTYDLYKNSLSEHKKLVKTARACGEHIEPTEIDKDDYKQYSYYVPATDTYETIIWKDDYTYLICENLPSEYKEMLEDIINSFQQE